MTEKEVLQKQKVNGNTVFYLIQVGMFLRAYGNGAFALHRLMGYSVRREQRKNGDIILAGFPAKSFDAVKLQMEEKNVTLQKVDDKTYLFQGIDGTPDLSLIKEASQSVSDKAALYVPRIDERVQKDVLRELLSINIYRCTPKEAFARLRDLQIRCLSHMEI